MIDSMALREIVRKKKIHQAKELGHTEGAEI